MAFVGMLLLIMLIIQVTNAFESDIDYTAEDRFLSFFFGNLFTNCGCPRGVKLQFDILDSY